MRKLFLAFIYCFIMRGFLRIIVGIKYLNKEALKKHNQFIVVSNHNSHVDTMAILSALSVSQIKNTHPVAAGDYFGKSKAKAFITKLFTNAILIRRTQTEDGQNPIESMCEALQKGHSLILFPEGSRGEPGKMQQFKKGIGVILKKHPEIPYIPVYMKGMGKVLPKGERLLVPFDTFVTFGEPTFCEATEVETIVEEIEQVVIKMSERSF